LVWDKLHDRDAAVPKVEPTIERIIRSLESLPQPQVSLIRRIFRSAEMDDWLPKSGREELWLALGNALAVELPSLIRGEGVSPPRVPSDCADFLTMSFWIAEHYPETVEWLQPPHPHEAPTIGRTWAYNDVKRDVYTIIAKTLGVRDDEVRKDARMIHDLGMS
jgi:hypothetical protein